jgi:hypothetical protein
LAVSGALAVGTNAELLSAASRGNITINGASTSILTFGVGAVAKAYFFHDNTHLTLANYTATGNIDFNTFSGADGTRMRLTNAGSLGIGTTTIGSRLQVNGNAAIGYSASTAGPTNGLSISGNTTIGTTTAAGKFTIDPDDNQVGLAITGTSLTSANINRPSTDLEYNRQSYGYQVKHYKHRFGCYGRPYGTSSWWYKPIYS